MPDNLRKIAYPVFNPQFVHEGEILYKKGIIHNFFVQKDRANAQVGISVNELCHTGVVFDMRNSQSPDLVGACECEDYFDDGTCKHLWALIKYCDLKGLLQDIQALGYYPAHASEIMDGKLFHEIPSKPKSRWKKELALIKDIHPVTPPKRNVIREAEVQLVLYPDDFDAGANKIYLEMHSRIRRKNGDWGKWNIVNEGGLPVGLPDEIREPAAQCIAYSKRVRHYASWREYRVMELQLALDLFPWMFDLDAACVMTDNLRFDGLDWDASDPWRFEMELREDGEAGHYQAIGLLRRKGEFVEVNPGNVQACFKSGWAVVDNQLMRIDNVDVAPWFERFSDLNAPMEIPVDEADAFIETIMNRRSVPHLRLPGKLKCDVVSARPVPVLAIHPPSNPSGHVCPARLEFEYEGTRVISTVASSSVMHQDSRNIMRRDSTFEADCVQKLRELGLPSVHSYVDTDPRWQVTQNKLPNLVSELHGAGWMVIAQGKPFRASSSFSASVKTGTDWFDLEVACDFNGVTASLPKLLDALKNKQAYIVLDDGSMGMLPEEWLRKFGGIASLGEVENDAIRFQLNQSILLDAWLAAMPDAAVDESFARTRERIAEHGIVKFAKAPAGFKGELRPYQREGLSWLECLQRLELGGCLADDMGLGKTVQVLALLEKRRTRRKKEKLPPSLVVVPKSLIYNWLREAERFAPKLKMVDYTGTDRSLNEKADVLLTTYGTLRRDIATLKDMSFDYLILDESTAIKNAGAQTAKAVRLLRGRHRLAMSGTPVENHLGELWSLFEFLSPGLLGKSKSFQQLFGRDPAPEQREMLGRAVRPFILRRTKSQVAKDLPERQEDTLYCELPEQQRKLYDELRDYYRVRLLKKIKDDGLNKHKIIVLEALLRLRQAACHHGLINAEHFESPSAKFETLIPQLVELAGEGHKALIFSQFTSYLTLLHNELAKLNYPAEYLDGKTQNRQERVDRFQTDPDCPFFLISLKAGGVGLNLTAADYVFLLDPWWNPAVEAQAIDRAHRIGQTRKVMAYRLIARDTVEEKVLALQENKRELAEAILNEDNAVLRNLTVEDLAFLLE
jgi:superfamily II DNA or RNA helicase